MSDLSDLSDSLSPLLRDLATLPKSRDIGDPWGAGVGPGDRIGRFEILRELGRGGFGIVFEARDTELGRRVAVKVLRREGPNAGRPLPPLVELFRREAATAAQLNHPNIATLHDYGSLNGLPYLILELLRGETLSRRLRRGILGTREAVDVMIQVSRALVHAHQGGIIHRDLKPRNVFLLDDGQVKLLDFGLSRVVVAMERGQVDVVLPRSGTPGYMSPEQWTGSAQDERTDIYSAGVLLYEMLGGQPSAESTEQSPRPPPEPKLTLQLPDVPAPLLNVVRQALEENPQNRFQKAQDLLDALLSVERSLEGSTAAAEHPYRYLEPFTERDAPWFFGRQRATRRMATKLATRPLLVLLGPSGAGKSSLVQAGLLPLLRRDGQAWTVIHMRPGRHPLWLLRERLLEHCGEVAKEFLAEPDSLREKPGLAGEVVRAHARQKHGRMLLFVDQFEELYAQVHDPNERAAFAAALLAVADDPQAPIRLILALRDDFLVRLAEHGELRDAVVANLLVLGPPDASALNEALCGPAQKLGYELEAGLAEEMVTALQREVAPFPLLQLAASRLWEERDSTNKRVGRGTLDRMGGVPGILAAHANEILKSLPHTSDVALARSLLCSLVSADLTRQQVDRDELLARFEDRDAAARVLQQLTDGRLLTASKSSGGDLVELAHESLLQGWNELSGWLGAARERKRQREALERDAASWHGAGRPVDFLWRGQRLTEELRRHRALGEVLSPQERAFLNASRARRRWRRLRSLLVAGIAAVACVLAAALPSRGDESPAGVSEAERQRLHWMGRVFNAAAAERDPLTKALLLVELAQQGEPAGGAQLAHQVAAQSIPVEVLRGHSGPLTAVAFSADGRRLVTAAKSGSVRVWGPGGKGVALPGYRGQVLDVAFDPTGKRVAAACEDRLVRVWTVDDAAPPLLLRGHGDWVLSVAFDRRGRRILSVSADQTARLWRADGSGKPRVFGVKGASVSRARFSPDGQRVATALSDGTVRVWRVSGHRRPRVLSGHTKEVTDVAFSPDGARLASASLDHTARVHDLRGSAPATVLRGHLGPVGTVSFSPGGTHVLTSSTDRTARVWRADGTGEPAVLSGHEAPLLGAAFATGRSLLLTFGEDGRAFVWRASGRGGPLGRLYHEGLVGASFSPGGRRVATASRDRTIRLWRSGRSAEPRIFGKPSLSAPGKLYALPTSIWTADFSPDGRLIVTAEADGIARIWRTDGEGPPIALRGHESEIFDASFSPDGRRVVTASFDGTARIWDTRGAAAPIVLRGHEGKVYTASFSPDGKRVVTASTDGTARVWRSDGGGRPVILRGHGATVRRAAFGPKGRLVVTASVDGTARIWQADGSRQPQVLRGHEGGVLSAEFDSLGKRVVTASYDRTARVWRVGAITGPVVLRGHKGTVWSAHFSPNGRRVVTGSYDGTARVWRADGRGQPTVLRGHRGEVNSAVFDPSGHRVLTASFDGTARLWAADGRGDALVLGGHTRWLSHAAFSSDGAALLTADHDATVRVWRAPFESPAVVLRRPVDRSRPDPTLSAVGFSPDGKHLLAASHDGSVRIWRTDRPGRPRVLAHPAAVTAATFSPDGLHIATASSDRAARIWSTRGAAAPTVLRGHRDRIERLAFSPNGAHLAAASLDGTARVWRVADGKLRAVLRGHTGVLRDAAWAPDGTWVVTASYDGTARIWSLRSGELPRVLKGHQGWVVKVAVSADGTRLATASTDRTARVWTIDGSRPSVVLSGHTHPLTAIAFRPDGDAVVTGAYEGTARIWRTEGAWKPTVLEGHRGPLTAVAFSSDGSRVLTASQDGTSRLWRTDGVGEPRILGGHHGFVTGAVFSPDGTQVATASSDGAARVWHLRWADIVARLRGATRACLTAGQRMKLLAEAPPVARKGAAACEDRARGVTTPALLLPGE